MLFTFCYQICMFYAWFFIIICKIYQKYWNFDKKIVFLGLPGIKVWPNCLFLGSIIMSWAHTHGLGVQNWIRKKSKKNGSKLTPSPIFLKRIKLESCACAQIKALEGRYRPFYWDDAEDSSKRGRNAASLISDDWCNISKKRPPSSLIRFATFLPLNKES